ncbi:MAG: cytochrome c oxidase subunit II [Bryobacteraceae bacterium]
MGRLRELLMPVAGSTFARQVDPLFMFLVGLSAFFFVLIAGLTGWFILRYRRGRAARRGQAPTHNTALELTWSLIPLVLVVVIFFWGFHGYISAAVAPADALEIKVIGKRWLWQFEYPNGLRTVNDLRIPLGKPVKLVMISEDVIHSFYVPSFRIKQDVLPSRYTQLWFEAAEPGIHRLLCAEYCGRGHSDMLGTVQVLSQEEYQHWLDGAGAEGEGIPLPELGRQIYTQYGCETCHSLDGSRREGPSFKGIFGKPVLLTGGQSVVADENYIRESILNPQAKIVAGYQPVMPTFQGLLNERQINALIEFIKELK